MKPRVDLEAFYPHPPERVWRALTDPAEVAHWLLPGDLEPRVGHRFEFDAAGAGGDKIACEVVEAEEPRRLSYTWQTMVTWTLEPAVGGTRVRLEHTGAGVPVPLSACLGTAAGTLRLPFRARPARRAAGMARSFRRRPIRARQQIFGGAQCL